MLPIIAGIVSSLISGGLPKVAQSVIEKGTEYVEDKLGIKLKPEMSQEELQKVSEAAMKHEEFLIQEENKNTADARDMNEHIQDSQFASWLAKNSAYLLDFIIVIASVVLTFIAFFTSVPIDNKELVYTLVGSLWTYSGVVINFHRATSIGRQRKDEIISRKV